MCEEIKKLQAYKLLQNVIYLTSNEQREMRWRATLVDLHFVCILWARCWWRSWVEALRYKPEGHGFDSRCCHWKFY
jgi:hypothetical protein